MENPVPEETTLLEVLFTWDEELDTMPVERGTVPVENAVPVEKTWLEVPLE